VTPAEEAAHRLGLLAGRKFRDSGVPSPNKLDGGGKGKAKLAAAWRRGYMAGQVAD